jgi:hypothetical protein
LAWYSQGVDEAQIQLGVCYDIGMGVLQSHREAARLWRLAADQGHTAAQVLLGRMLVEGSAVGAPADVRAGAKLIARAAQCADPRHDVIRPEALKTLRMYVDKREVVWACCIGCGATHGLKRCVKCHAARFCGSACMRHMWPVHKRCCALWVEQRDDAPQ